MDQQSIFNSLRNKEPEVWLAYLRRFENGEPLTGLAMDVIFHHTAPLAKRLDSLEWAEVAVRAMELEARYSSTQTIRESALSCAMGLRAWFIARKGARRGDFLLDKDAILRWAEEGLTLPLLAAREKAERFGADAATAASLGDRHRLRQLGDDASRLSWIKHRLNVVKVLEEAGELPSDSVLREWLQIRTLLP